MARKTRKFEREAHPADGHLRNMKYRDIKRECVARGMGFDEVIRGTIPQLSNWFRDHFYDDVVTSRVDEFDDWQEEQIRTVYKERGDNPRDVLHPSLRLGFIAERDEEGNTIKRKHSKMLIKKRKKKRERTTDGIFNGTKKSLTYSSQKEGKTKEETIKIVLEQFPDASEKSIGIWYNKAKKVHSPKQKYV